MSSIEEIRGRMRARVWQAIAENGLSKADRPSGQLQGLADDIVEGVLLEMDALLEDVDTEEQDRVEAMPRPDCDDEERVLWQGRPFLSLSERYLVTTERVRVTRGLLARDREDIEMIRLQDIDHKQSFGERLLRVGDITLRSADASKPEVVLRNVQDPVEVHETIRRAMIDARKRVNFGFREEM